jgi:hypothetical protein
MGRRMTRLLIGVGLLFPFVGATATPSYAVGAQGGVVVGSGTVSPGLTSTPTNVSYTLSTSNVFGLPSVEALADTSGGATSGEWTCFFSGSTGAAPFPVNLLHLNETVLFGYGTWSGACSTAVSVVGSGSASCTVTYVRVDAAMVLDGKCEIFVNGVDAGSAAVAAGALFVPTSANPTTSFQLVGGGAGFNGCCITVGPPPTSN